MKTLASNPTPAKAFTLIELLVVMGIIGVLAAMTVGLSTVASRSSKTSRMQKDLREIETCIENYKSSLGSYPRDNPTPNGPSPLYYELRGTYFDQGYFTLAGETNRIGAGFLTDVFNVPTLDNAARAGDEPKFKYDSFKPDQHKKIAVGSVTVDILVAPLPGPDSIKATDGSLANPWHYDKTSFTRHNKASFDLWAEINLGSSTTQIHNW